MKNNIVPRSSAPKSNWLCSSNSLMDKNNSGSVAEIYPSDNSGIAKQVDHRFYTMVELHGSG
ncbi:hypothetical protein ACPV4E_14445 [Vibrio alfacsensis]